VLDSGFHYLDNELGCVEETKTLFETSIKTPKMLKDQFDEILKENPRVDRKKLKVVGIVIDGKTIIYEY
jgi:hypothetical protein